MSATPGLAVRGSEGLAYFTGPPSNTYDEAFGSDGSSRCRVVRFSSDGTLVSWCNGTSVFVVTLPECETILELDLPRTVGLCFSPDNRCISTFEQFTGNPQNAGQANFHIYDIETGSCLRKVTLRGQNENWMPQWTEDGKLCAQCASGEILFYQDNNFEKAVQRLQLPGLTTFQLAPGDGPAKVAVYVPGAKGAPSFVRLFKYPNFQTGGVLANKSFYKADRAHIIWNKQATAVLVIAVADVDSSGASYYGEQTLHYLGVNGEGSNVTLSKKGPIYSVDWNPVANEFCVVYGFMPAKASLFNSKCEALFHFGTGPRNSVYFNPAGSLICLAGFGNLRGIMEFWERKELKKISSCQAMDSTFFQWSPDSEHFVTATCSPRLREGNGFKIWHYNGSLLFDHPIAEAHELWEVCWRPFPKGTFKTKKIDTTTRNLVEDTKPAPYRPPSARSKPTVIDPLHASRYEAPSSTKATIQEPQNLSKSALKNKKKREAKAKQKQSNQDNRSEEQRDALAIASHILGPQMPQPEVGVMKNQDPEMEKKIKNIRKKLKQIEKLKEQQSSGKTLEANQLEKIESESQLLKDLQQLEIGS